MTLSVSYEYKKFISVFFSVNRNQKGRFLMARTGENIYKRKDGRWEGRCIVNYDKNGKAKYKYVYAKTYKAVKDKLLLEPVHIKIASKIIAKVRFPKYRTSSLS